MSYTDDKQLKKEGVSKLGQGVVNHYGATFICLESSLEKLNTKQEILTVAVQEEKERINRGRLKDEMGALTERSNSLRKRAARLQEAKQMEAMDREVKRDSDRRREEELIAKPSSSSSQ